MSSNLNDTRNHLLQVIYVLSVLSPVNSLPRIYDALDNFILYCVFYFSADVFTCILAHAKDS